MAAEIPYLVIAMYTDGYAAKAARLRQSCERFGLPHDLQRVPTVHRSISRHGTADAAYTKARFILGALARRRGPVLYVDADCEFREPPALIGELLAGGTEFAIYNWLADERSDAYVPVQIVTRGSPGGSGRRYWRYASRQEYHDPEQLLCSGAVQLYADTPAARLLLERWHANVVAFASVADDHCMDYTYNNRGAELAALRAAWLPRAYARYGWWISTRPVIDHPELAAEGTHFADIPEAGGRRQFYPERARRLGMPPAIGADRIIDTERGRLLTIDGGAVVRDEPAQTQFWV